MKNLKVIPIAVLTLCVSVIAQAQEPKATVFSLKESIAYSLANNPSSSIYKNEVLIQFTADKNMGGITIEECAQLNRAIIEAIDNEGFLPEDGYSLEFASPGLDRPLVGLKDFARNLNREIHLFLQGPLEGKKEWSGILMGISDGKLTVFTKKKIEVVLPLGQIIKGMLVI